MKFLSHLFVLIILLAPTVILAQPVYQPLVGLPGVNNSTLGADSNFDTYINALYALSIGIAALLAVIKIIIAGVKWMLTDIVTSKGEAKKDIQGALLGLIIVLSAVLILTVINPQLVNVNLEMETLTIIDAPATTPKSTTPLCTKAGTITHVCEQAGVVCPPANATPAQKKAMCGETPPLDTSMENL